MEVLEDRLAPAVFNVSPLSTDGGPNSLRSVVRIASINGEDDTINIQAGTVEFLFAGRGENSGITGDLDIAGDGGQTLTIQGAGRDQTFIDANGLDRVLHLTNNGSGTLTVILRNLSLVGGRATDGPGGSAAGGAILATGSGAISLTLENVGIGTFVAQSNFSAQGNIALGSDGTAGSGNDLDGEDGGDALGGGVYLSTTAASSVSILGSSLVVNNQALGGAGGIGQNVTANDEQQNTPGGDGGSGGDARGGGLAVVNSTVTLANSVLIGTNQASSGKGGNGGDGIGNGDGGDGGAGGLVAGGGLYLENGTMTATGAVVIDSNQGSGGKGGNPGKGVQDQVPEVLGNGDAGLAGHGGDVVGAGIALVDSSLTFSGEGTIGNNAGTGGTGGNGSTGVGSGNNSNGGRAGVTRGGGLYALGSTVSLTDIDIVSNSITTGNGGNGAAGRRGGNLFDSSGRSSEGGGLWLDEASDGTSSSLTINGGTIRLNTVGQGTGGTGSGNFGGSDTSANLDTGGGGVFFGGGGTANITGVTIADNQVAGGIGGAGAPTGVSGNAAGGGLLVRGDNDNTTTLNLIASTVSGNTAVGGAGLLGVGLVDGSDGGNGRGGGIRITSGSGSNVVVNVTRSTIGANNSARGGVGANGSQAGSDGGLGGNGRGGGIEISAGELVVTNSTISTNTSVGGAGGNGGSAIVGNGGDGGTGGDGTGAGLFISGGTTTIQNSTVALNSTFFGTGGLGGNGGAGGAGGGGGGAGDDAGGGLVSSASANAVTVISTLFANNVSTASPDYSGPSGAVVSNSLITNSTGSNWQSTNGNLLDRDPELGALKKNGGPTLTHAIDEDRNNSSPAINAGSNPSGLAGDQRNFLPRDAEGTPDIGAFETEALPTYVQRIAYGSDAGAPARIDVYDMFNNFLYTINPFGGFSGGVRVATADVNGDNVEDIIAAAGPGGGPHVLVFDGANPGQVLHNFFAYGIGFTGGVYVAAGDVNGDGTPDIITGAGAGGGPHVQVFSGSNPANVLKSFFAYSPAFTGGVRVASGNFDGDDFEDIVTTPGFGGGPHVLVFASSTDSILHNFFAYDPGFTGGVYVATGDFNGDGIDDIVTGAGAGGGPQVRIFDGADSSQVINSFFAYSPAFTGGVRVATYDRDGDGSTAELITVPGIGGGPHVRTFDFDPFVEIDSFFTDVGSTGTGLFVG